MKKIRVLALAVCVMACSVPSFAVNLSMSLLDGSWTWSECGDGNIINFRYTGPDGAYSYTIRKEGSMKVLEQGAAWIDTGNILNLDGGSGKYQLEHLGGEGSDFKCSALKVTNMQACFINMNVYIDKPLANLKIKEAGNFLKKKNYHEALNSIEESLKLYPQNKAALYKKGEILEQQAKGDKDQAPMFYYQAMGCYQFILQIDPKDKKAARMVKTAENMMDKLQPGWRDMP